MGAKRKMLLLCVLVLGSVLVQGCGGDHLAGPGTLAGPTEPVRTTNFRPTTGFANAS